MASTTVGPALYGLTAEEKIEQLERDLAMAETRIEQLERQLIAAGVLDPELAP
jgi:chaperonin cofactor prefoldin